MVDVFLAVSAGLNSLIFLFACIAIGTPFLTGSVLSQEIELSWWTFSVGGGSTSVGDLSCDELKTAMHSGEAFGILFILFSFPVLLLVLGRVVKPELVPKSRVLYSILFGVLLLFSIIEFGSQSHIKSNSWCSNTPEGFIYGMLDQTSFAGSFVLYILAFLLAIAVLGLELFQIFRGEDAVAVATYTNV